MCCEGHLTEPSHSGRAVPLGTDVRSVTFRASQSPPRETGPWVMAWMLPEPLPTSARPGKEHMPPSWECCQKPASLLVSGHDPRNRARDRERSGRSSSPAGPGEGAPPREDRSQQSRRDGLGPLRGLFSGEAWPRTLLPLDVWRVQAGPAFPTWPAVVCLMAPRPPGDPTPCREPLLFGVTAVSPLVAWGPGRHRNKQPAYPLRVLAHGHLRRQEKTDFGVLDLLSLKDHRIGPGLGSSLPRRPAQREGQWQRPRGPAGACPSPQRVVLADEFKFCFGSQSVRK